MKKPIDERLIGRLAYKKRGFFSGLVGVLEKNEFITPYKIVFPDDASVGVHEDEFVLIEEKYDNRP